MRSRPRKILAVLGILLVVVWVRALFPRRADPSPRVRLLPTAQVPNRTVHAPMEEVPDPWGDSPFLIDRGSRTTPLLEQAAAKGTHLLNGILWDPQSPSAIINNRVLTRGDRLGEWSIVEIQKDHVVLSNGAETKVLRPEE